MPIKLKCNNCGKDYQTSPSNKNSKYCSKECRVAYLGRNMQVYICESCEKEFRKNDHHNSKHHFCCLECKKLYFGVNYDKLKSDFENRGLILITDGRIKTSDKLKFICKKHPELGEQYVNYNDFYHGADCKQCSKERASESQRFDFSFVKEQFEKRNFTLLDTTYKNANTKMKCICNKHPNQGILHNSYNNIKQGHGCMLCGYEKTANSSRLTFEEVTKRFIDKDFTLISSREDYQNNNSILKYICNKHPNVGIQTTTLTHLQEKNGCRVCALERMKYTQIFSHEKFIADMKIKNKDITITGKYDGMLSKIGCECNICGYKWSSAANSIYYNKTGCPKCNISHGERETARCLDSMNIPYDIQKKFDDLIGLGRGLLSYDFYIPKHNTLIEYQGEQHEKYLEGFHLCEADFLKQIEHDRLKRTYAESNKYNFLEIWYWDFDNIETILHNNLK